MGQLSAEEIEAKNALDDLATQMEALGIGYKFDQDFGKEVAQLSFGKFKITDNMRDWANTDRNMTLAYFDDIKPWSKEVKVKDIVEFTKTLKTTVKTITDFFAK